MTLQQAKQIALEKIDSASSRKVKADAWYLSKKLAEIERGIPSMKFDDIVKRLEKL